MCTTLFSVGVNKSSYQTSIFGKCLYSQKLLQGHYQLSQRHKPQQRNCHIIVLILHRTLDTSLLCETNKQKIFQNAVHWSQMCGQLAMCTHHTNIHKTANSWVYVSINRGLSNLLWEQVHHASCAHSLPSVNLYGKLCHVWNCVGNTLCIATSLLKFHIIII